MSAIDLAVKQQLCPWCGLRQTFLPGPRAFVVLCSFCGSMGIKHGAFVRRANIKDSDGLSTEELERLMDEGLEIRRQHRAIEPHLVLQEIASRWKMSLSTIERLFEAEPGVVRIGKTKRSLRVPLSVCERVHAKLTREEAPTERVVGTEEGQGKEPNDD